MSAYPEHSLSGNEGHRSCPIIQDTAAITLCRILQLSDRQVTTVVRSSRILLLLEHLRLQLAFNPGYCSFQVIHSTAGRSSRILPCQIILEKTVVRLFRIPQVSDHPDT
jgi:hypothetical protein